MKTSPKASQDIVARGPQYPSQAWAPPSACRPCPPPSALIPHPSASGRGPAGAPLEFGTPRVRITARGSFHGIAGRLSLEAPPVGGIVSVHQDEIDGIAVQPRVDHGHGLPGAPGHDVDLLVFLVDVEL